MRISVPISASILLLSITLALAADDPLMKQAQGLFQPIPSEPPAIKGVTTTPAMVELGKDLYFDPRLSPEPQYQLQHLPSDWAWRRGHAVDVNRT